MFEKLKNRIITLKGKKPELQDFKDDNSVAYLSAEYLRDGKLTQFAKIDSVSDKYFCTENDLLIIWDGSNSGEVFMGKEGILSSTMAKIEVNDNLYLKKYLYYFLKNNFTILNEKVTGAAIPHLNRSTLENLEIYKASLAEQKEMVDVLDAASEIIRLRTACIESAQFLIPALFQEMFGDPLNNNKNLTKEKIGKIFTLTSGKFIPSKELDTNGQYPVYGGNGIKGYHNEFLFEDSKICIGRVGVKCGCVHKTKPNSWITDNALYINNYLIPINETYLKVALTQINLNQYAKRSAQPVISQTTIYNQYILLPQIEQQELFAKKVQEIESYIKSQQAELENAKTMFQSLLHHSFTGELTRHKFGGDANG